MERESTDGVCFFVSFYLISPQSFSAPVIVFIDWFFVNFFNTNALIRLPTSWQLVIRASSENRGVLSCGYLCAHTHAHTHIQGLWLAFPQLHCFSYWCKYKQLGVTNRLLGKINIDKLTALVLLPEYPWPQECSAFINLITNLVQYHKPQCVSAYMDVNWCAVSGHIPFIHTQLHSQPLTRLRKSKLPTVCAIQTSAEVS